MLANDEYGIGMDLATKQHVTVIPKMVNYKAEASAFQSYMFQQNVVENMKPLDCWKSHASRLSQERIIVVDQLLTGTASAAGVEQYFHHLALYIQICAIDGELRELGRTINQQDCTVTENTDSTVQQASPVRTVFY